MTEETRPLTPEARRRPDALSGAPVRLADGNEWELPKPRARFSPAADGYAVVLRLDGADGYDAVAKAVDAPPDGAGISEVIGSQLTMARMLLQRNYEVDDVECGSLIQFSYDEDDPEGFAMKEDVLAVGLGLGPKHDGGTKN